MVIIQVQLAVSSLVVVILVQLLSVITGGYNHSHNWQVSTSLAILLQLASVIKDCNPTGKCYQFISDTWCHHVCIYFMPLSQSVWHEHPISVQSCTHCLPTGRCLASENEVNFVRMTQNSRHIMYKQPIDGSMDRWIDGSINQSINQSISQSVNQPINQSINLFQNTTLKKLTTQIN